MARGAQALAWLQVLILTSAMAMQSATPPLR